MEQGLHEVRGWCELTPCTAAVSTQAAVVACRRDASLNTVDAPGCQGGWERGQHISQAADLAPARL